MATNSAINLATAASGKLVQAQGVGVANGFTTATYPSTATSTGTLLRADGTNWSATTSTYPNTNAASTLLYASATNTMDALATGNNGLLVTSNTGVPSILAGPGATGRILQSNTAAAPSFSTATYPSTAGTTGTILRSNGTNILNTTATYPNTTTANQILYSSATNTISEITTANNSILSTNASGVPSLGTTLNNDYTFTKATSGATTTLTVSNTSNTASSAANILAQVAGGTAADATHQSTISGGQAWTWGLDNSDSDAFVLAASSALGTTNVMRSSIGGEITQPLQPAFLAYLNTSVLNVTGDNTVYTAIYDTEVYDQNGDFTLATSTFTAPVTGKYRIEVYLTIGGGTSINGAIGRINSSNNTYRFSLPLNASDTTAAAQQAAVLADMDAADTFTISVNAADSGGKIDDFMGLSGGFLRNWVSASLTC